MRQAGGHSRRGSAGGSACRRRKWRQSVARLIDANGPDIQAVLIGGRLRLVRTPDIAIGDDLSSELLSVGGRQFALGFAETEDDGLGGMQSSTAIPKLAYGLANCRSLVRRS